MLAARHQEPIRRADRVATLIDLAEKTLQHVGDDGLTVRAAVISEGRS
jgi:hypothetical protein